ncbi:MAG: aminoacyl-tRNA hydrolase [Prolixibacteraceae bacterium]|nr:aminoacyl-tRNA hydrolase [Prolixibacteraceae bacterium]
MLKAIKSKQLEAEMQFSTSRSSGPGGQHVNKVNSKVELRFHIGNSMQLSDTEKQRIRMKLANRINGNDELVLISQNERSMLQNKTAAIDKFYQLLVMALKPVKARRPTRPTAASVEKRLQTKKMLSTLKRIRRNQPD